MNDELKKGFTIWWNKLQQDNGGRAQLRRCNSPEEAALHQQTHLLKHTLPRWLSFEAVATISAVSAHIKNSGSKRFIESLATPRERNGAIPMSENHFRQLLSCKNWNELHRSLRRAVTILDGTVHLESFLDTVMQWNDEFKGKYHSPGKSLKFRLSEEYYETAIRYENNH